MKLPLLLIVVAGLSAAVVGYGTYPVWMRFPHGLDVIVWSRRLQWLLVAVSLIASILLMGLVISGRRRAWWLIGLAPVMALFVHRFATGPAAGRMFVAEDPPFLSADDAKAADEEWVVGLRFGDKYCAYRYSTLFTTPVILQKDQDKRIILMWSAYANRVLVLPIGQELRARDLEVVSTPANAILLYNSRRGQFINGLTGQTVQGEKPMGFGTGMPMIAQKMPWKDWRALHPDTKVLDRIGPPIALAPTQPIQPAWPMPVVKLDRPAETRLAVMGTGQAIAIEEDQLTAAPLNSNVADVPVAIFRNQPDQPIRAFDRRINDHIVKLEANLSATRHPLARFVDKNSGSGWNAAGTCVDAPVDAKLLKGRSLVPMAIDEGVPLGVMKFWYPDLKLEVPPAPPIAIDTEEDADQPAKHGPKKRTHKPKPARPQ